MNTEKIEVYCFRCILVGGLLFLSIFIVGYYSNFEHYPNLVNYIGHTIKDCSFSEISCLIKVENVGLFSSLSKIGKDSIGVASLLFSILVIVLAYKGLSNFKELQNAISTKVINDEEFIKKVIRELDAEVIASYKTEFKKHFEYVLDDYAMKSRMTMWPEISNKLESKLDELIENKIQQQVSTSRDNAGFSEDEIDE
ncbi:hypothetical protein [Halobacteriovorax sp. CON-3]|uniref:hypothetical protein n=1 Tax=Halobacteriovorax sp. CON-3 TaxID=3157710 RepID=UPI0037234FF0